MADKTVTLEIDGATYDLPTLDTLDLDEMRVLKHAGFLMPQYEEALNSFDPDFMIALLVIAKRRTGEDADAASVGGVKVLNQFVDQIAAALDEDEKREASADPVPPARRRGSGSPTNSKVRELETRRAASGGSAS